MNTSTPPKSNQQKQKTHSLTHSLTTEKKPKSPLLADESESVSEWVSCGHWESVYAALFLQSPSEILTDVRGQFYSL